MSVLDTLHVEHKARQQRLKDAALKEATAPIPKPKPQDQELEPIPAHNFDIIFREVCSFYKCRKIDILSYRKFKGLPECRGMIAYMAHHMTSMTNVQIGNKLGRDPTSIWYAITKIKPTPKFKFDVLELEKRITALYIKHKEGKPNGAI